MAAWGPNLYQDDLAEDIREFYMNHLKQGKSNDSVTEELISSYSEAINDSDEAPVFWFALADSQWKVGRLLSWVKDKAMVYLESKNNIRQWEQENPTESNKRKKVLAELQLRLNSEQPPMKKISPIKLYHCTWQIGDTFAYHLESEQAETYGLSQKYAVLVKVNENSWYPGHIIPTIRLKITSDNNLPNDEETINALRYIPTQHEVHFGKRDYYYIMDMISTSKRVIPKKLIYLGNFPSLTPPRNELVHNNKINNCACHWSKFEEKVIELYKRYNV